VRIVVLTIFPGLVEALWSHGMVRRAVEQRAVTALAVNIRDFAPDRHHVTDDRPYGGGCGMVMKPEPLAAALRHAREAAPGARTILMAPQGRRFDQSVARELSEVPGMILVCGRYEGVDDRLIGNLIDEELSIGDYVLTGGEIAAMAVVDAVTRLIPGVLGGEESAERDSFSDGLLEHGHYTRPPVFEGEAVPEVLLSGHHARIERWRLESSLMRTFVNRPDLLIERPVAPAERDIFEGWRTRLQGLLGDARAPSAGTRPRRRERG
jgi:tRNA (guanine37-N1)-methyltransferase